MTPRPKLNPKPQTKPKRTSSRSHPAVPRLRLDKVRRYPDSKQQDDKDRAAIDAHYDTHGSSRESTKNVALQLQRSGARVVVMEFTSTDQTDEDECEMMAEFFSGLYRYAPSVMGASKRIIPITGHPNKVDAGNEQKMYEWFDNTIRNWSDADERFMVWLIRLKKVWSPISHSVCALFDRKSATFEYFDSNGGLPNASWFGSLIKAIQGIEFRHGQHASGSPKFRPLKPLRAEAIRQTGTNIGVCQAYTVTFVYLRVLGGYTFKDAIDYLSSQHCRLGFSRPVLTAIRGGFQTHYTTKTKRRRKTRRAK